MLDDVRKLRAVLKRVAEKTATMHYNILTDSWDWDGKKPRVFNTTQDGIEFITKISAEVHAQQIDLSKVELGEFYALLKWSRLVDEAIRETESGDRSEERRVG